MFRLPQRGLCIADLFFADLNDDFEHAPKLAEDLLAIAAFKIELFFVDLNEDYAI